MPNETGLAGNSRDVLYVLFRHKWFVVTFVVVLVGVVGVRAVLAPDVYESEAKIVLTGRKDSTVSMLTGITANNQLNTEIELLNSRGFAEAVVDRIGPALVLTDPPPPQPGGVVGTVKFTIARGLDLIREHLRRVGVTSGETPVPDPIVVRMSAIEVFEANLEIANEPQADVLNLVYAAVTPSLAQRILQETVSIYLEKHLEIHATPVSLQRLTVETERLRQEMIESERRLEEFVATIGDGSIEQQTDLAVSRVRELQSQIERTEAQISGARVTIANTGSDFQLRAQEREARLRLQTLTAELSVLERQIADAQRELRRLNESARRVAELRADLNASRDQYLRFDARLEEARIAQTLESEAISNVSIMQAPTFSLRSTGSGLRLVLVAMVVGIAVAVGMAFVLEYLDHSVRTPEDTLKRLNLPTLASLPLLNTRRVRTLLRREARRRRKQTDSMVVVPMRLADHVITWQFFLPDVRHAFDELRGAVLSTLNGHAGTSPVFAVTSCQRHEGVSTVAAGLATAMAVAGGEDVLLVNANTHHPDVDIVPGEFCPPHLIEIDARNYMLTTTSHSPFRSDDGKRAAQVETVLERRTLDGMLVSVDNLQYRAVVLDLPSMREGGTPLIHAARADATILVVESERVKREVVERARARIENAGGRVAGVVLNRRRYYIPKWLYARS